MGKKRPFCVARSSASLARLARDAESAVEAINRLTIQLAEARAKNLELRQALKLARRRRK